MKLPAQLAVTHLRNTASRMARDGAEFAAVLGYFLLEAAAKSSSPQAVTALRAMEPAIDELLDIISLSESEKRRADG